MENVPEAVNFLGVNIAHEVCKELEKNGYQVLWTILNAADYGVPQIRERLFVFAMKKEFEGEIILPQPSHQRADRNLKLKMRRGLKALLRILIFKYPKKLT